MKILIFCPYYPPHIGGLENHADEFNKYLSERGMDIVVFTPRLPQNAPEFETKYNGVKIIRFPAFEIVSNYPLPKFWSVKFWQLFYGLFKEKFDVIFSHTRFFNTSLLALAYAKIEKVRWIHIEHGSDFVQSGSFFIKLSAKLYDLTFGKLVIKKANTIIAVSSCVKDFIKKLVPQKNCTVIYRGFDVEKINSISPNYETTEKYKDKTIITYVGRLISGKGISDLIEAIYELPNKESFVCFLIGDGPERIRLEEKVKKLDLETKIIFYGYMSYEKTIGLLKISDIFVNPSYTEGLPTTIIEAALCKKAIVATDVGGTKEIIKDRISGLITSSRDITSLKKNLENLITNTELRSRLGKQAFNDVEKKFNWEKAIDNLIKILNENE